MASKLAIPIAIIAVSALAFTGIAFAYEANYNNNVPGEDVEGDTAKFTTVTAISVDASSVNHQYSTVNTYSNGDSIKYYGGVFVGKVYETATKIGTVKLVDENGAVITGAASSIAVSPVAPADGDGYKTAVSAIAITVVEDATTGGNYNVFVKYTYVTPQYNGLDKDGAISDAPLVYKIPAYTITLTYTPSS